VLVGDGAMQMNGMAELLTIKRFSGQWKDPRLIVCVFHNNDLNQVTWELRAMGGAPKFEPSQSLPDVSYADVANAMGIPGIVVEHDDDIGPAWDRALGADGPIVLDVRCDPEMPPIPTRHLRADQGADDRDSQRRSRSAPPHVSGRQDQGPGVHSAPPLIASEPLLGERATDNTASVVVAAGSSRARCRRDRLDERCFCASVARVPLGTMNSSHPVADRSASAVRQRV
jgi:hypothetical protein